MSKWGYMCIQNEDILANYNRRVLDSNYYLTLLLFIKCTID